MTVINLVLSLYFRRTSIGALLDFGHNPISTFHVGSLESFRAILLVAGLGVAWVRVGYLGSSLVEIRQDL